MKLEGLTSVHATKLLEEYGRNVIAEKAKSSIFKKFVEQISSFLIILLLLAAVLSFVIGELVDGTLIVVIVLVNAFFGIYQEFKAEQAVSALKKMTKSSIRVVRDGKEQEIDSSKLVPEDVIIIEEGVKLPADAKIINSHNLEINEAALTGESVPVIKNVGDPIYMGTIVSRGRAVAIVEKTGMKTRFGQIAEKLASVKDVQTPLQKKLTKLTEIVGLAGIIISVIIFGLSSIQGNPVFPSFLLAISVAVAVVPESLPAVMTVILSIGVKRMAQKNAVIRKLASIESLGSTTLIATDKTGTLTQNIMDVKEMWFDGKIHDDLSGKKSFSKTGELIIKNGIVCSTASLVKTHGGYDVLGDPTEGALLTLGRKFDMVEKDLRTKWELIDEVSFDSVKKRMSVLVKNDKEMIFSKGSPESILEISSHVLIDGKVHKLTDKLRDKVIENYRKWSEHGLRILGFAYQEDKNYKQIFHELQKSADPKQEGEIKYEEDGLVFLGMAALHDPPRPEVKDAIEKARSAGIKVVMITGDNEKTAEAIGVSVGLIKKGDAIITGDKIESASDQELLNILPHTKIFARTTPLHKSRIVSLYQKLGEIVAVTGDGVNDSVALKQADVGIAMGLVGTDVARETADMVILDDNFATIVNAVEEGRNIVIRLKKTIKYLFSGNISEGLVLMIGLALGFPPILIPIQILYVNMVSDGVPALALAFSPKQSGVMSQRPDRKFALLETKDIVYVLTVGLVTTIIVLASYVLFAGIGGYIGGDNQTVAFITIAIIQIIIFIDIWFFQSSEKHIRKMFPPVFLITVFIPVIIQFAIVRIDFLAELFKVSILDPGTYLSYILLSMSLIVVITLIRFTSKKIFRYSF